MSWPPIGWSFVRGKIQIAMVVGRVCRVVVGEGTFIQRRHSVNETNGHKKRVVVNEGGRSSGVPLYSHFYP